MNFRKEPAKHSPLGARITESKELLSKQQNLQEELGAWVNICNGVLRLIIQIYVKKK